MLEALESDAEPASGRSSFANSTVPLGSVSAPLGADGDRASPGPWEARYEWAEEASAPEISAQPTPLPRASLEAVARELKLTDARTASELHKLRREFMWRNHPDRRPEIPRELANARVAIANMLIDRALRKASLKKDRRA
jgi:hypothetical protein